MSNALEIDGKLLHPIRDAAQVVSYSRDYVTRLAREHKIKATYIGRQWFVDLESLKNYAETSAMEQEIRKKQLSEERKREQQLHAAAEAHEERQAVRASAVPLRAAVVASLVLSFGVLTGYLTHQLMSFDGPTSVAQVVNTQVAPTSVPVLERAPVAPAASVVEDVEPRPSQTIESMGEVRNGVFLFPPTASTSPQDLFSDNVLVEERADGSQWLHKLDSAGRPIGEPIPFIEVPLAVEDR